MIEDTVTIRRQQVERLNGWAETWWHYNRITLAMLLTIICALAWLYTWEHAERKRAQADAVVLANAPDMACYSATRSTSLIIAGGSQQAVDEALRQASYQIDATRGLWLAARARVAGPRPVTLVAQVPTNHMKRRVTHELLPAEEVRDLKRSSKDA